MLVDCQRLGRALDRGGIAGRLARGDDSDGDDAALQRGLRPIHTNCNQLVVRLGRQACTSALRPFSLVPTPGSIAHMLVYMRPLAVELEARPGLFQRRVLSLLVAYRQRNGVCCVSTRGPSRWCVMRLSLR